MISGLDTVPSRAFRLMFSLLVLVVGADSALAQAPGGSRDVPSAQVGGRPGAIEAIGTGAVAPVVDSGGASTANPLDELQERVRRVLSQAGLPFTDEQSRAVALMTEDRRKASEELFGQTMDFSAGPVQGQQMDRAVAAIQWVQAEFARRLTEYLTPEQVAAWRGHEAVSAGAEADGRGRPAPQRTQFVRINNNIFTAENASFPGGGFGGGGQGGGGGRGGQGGGRGGGATEVIERGGIGNFRGQMNFNLQDSRLNAKNHFASTKPPYQERQINGTFGGPVMPERLTTTVSFSQSEAQNASAVFATLPSGVFELGIVQPVINRSVNARNILQLADRHSVAINVRYGRGTSKNNSVGGFTLPERASATRTQNSMVELRQFSALSDTTVYETSLQVSTSGRRNQPFSEGMAINVLDAFYGGGGQDRSETSSRDYSFGNLLTRMGSRWTIKAGVNGSYATSDDISNNNFTGTYTFSSLADYIAGVPVTFRVTRGEPRIGVTQLELAPFIQNDIRINQRLTLMLGLRYEYQTNLADNNNIAPRVGFAWALGRSLVLRGGGGVFYQRLNDSMVQTQKRLNGTNQWEIVITNPTWPDPFQGGDVNVRFPSSVRVTDPALVAPSSIVAQVSAEKTFANNLFVTAAYDRIRGVNQFRSRNLNAPRPGETVNPDPTRGQVIQLESTARSTTDSLRFTGRQRFSIFIVNANYTFTKAFSNGDSWMALPSNNYDLDADWGRASFRNAHSFSASVNAQLPLGLFLTASHTMNSGAPYSITTGRDDNFDGVTNDRPAGVPRNSATGPGFQSTSFNISKAVFLGTPGQGGSGTNLNWFVNLSNAFNRVNYGTPSGVMTSTNFGISTTARNPRELEVGVRFSF